MTTLPLEFQLALVSFATALLIGVGVGTYSSIYIAGGLLVTMKLTRDDLIPPQVEEAVDDRP